MAGANIPLETVDMVGLVIALVLVAKMAISAGFVRSLQFQLAIFLMIWAVSEMPLYFADLGLINLAPIEVDGLIIHAVAMVLFAIFILFRFSKFVLKVQK